MNKLTKEIRNIMDSKMIIEIDCSDPDQCDHVVQELIMMFQDDPHLQGCKFKDIKEETLKFRRVIYALLEEGDSRVPRDMDQKSPEYTTQVIIHNDAIMEVSRALADIGYRQ